MFVLPVVGVEWAFAVGFVVLVFWLMLLFVGIDVADMELFDRLKLLVAEPAYENKKSFEN